MLNFELPTLFAPLISKCTCSTNGQVPSHWTWQGHAHSHFKPPLHNPPQFIAPFLHRWMSSYFPQKEGLEHQRKCISAAKGSVGSPICRMAEHHCRSHFTCHWEWHQEILVIKVCTFHPWPSWAELQAWCLVFESPVRSGYLVPRGSNRDWDRLAFVPKPKIT